MLAVIVFDRVLQLLGRCMVFGQRGARTVEVRGDVLDRWLQLGKAHRVGEEGGVESAVELADGGLL